VNRRAHVFCKFNCVIETEGLLKVTGSHVHITYGNVSETVQDRDFPIKSINRKCYMANRIVAIPITLSDLEGHLSTLYAGLLQCDFSYICAAVGKISSDIAHRAVPLR